jgi:F-type H+-transporting ATPase subunit b
MSLTTNARRLLAVCGLSVVLCFTLQAAAFSADSHVEGEAVIAAEHGDHGDGHGGDHSGGEAPLVPPTDLVFWGIVTFVVFLVVLKKAAFGPLVAGLDKRESKYRKLLDDAKADRDKAMALLAGHEKKLAEAQAEVAEIIAEARRDAERTKTDILASANSEAEATRKRALDDIGRARDQAVAQLFDHVRANVVAATEKVLARSLTDADHQRFVDEALSELRSSN